MVKRKRLTISEKKANVEIRKRLRDVGAMPPIKTRLNRKKFSEEVINDYEKDLDKYDDVQYIYKAISWMLPSINPKFKQQINLEQIGVLKTLKLAMEIKKFMETKLENGETKYSIDELYNKVVEPIKRL